MHDPAPGTAAEALPPRPKPSYVERRKAALRSEIAREAVRLFTANGVAHTTGEQIAEAVGISARTLWRYFPSKESCVRPLLAAGLDTAVEALRHWPEGTSLLEYIAGAADRGDLPIAEPVVLDLLRLTRREPSLRVVWLQAHDDALPVLAELLARRAGGEPDDLRVKVHAATLNGALRAAAEDFAAEFADRADAPPAELTARLHAALRAASEGLPY
ncbi:transcriptional regulator, TetR family [Actinomadura meyerae]|uniref:Transcriptional regulator, TetR family n=1 Tax=Actinomadura meyerae TaxID=240840 RepID=A0A239P7X1_9ACTN|nr:TetR/AcrR family transcriptional regulator [Actinomadura meyerae]SNT62489.1 transcriptional regulator, TetR family [Actinomadura meyerae]